MPTSLSTHFYVVSNLKHTRAHTQGAICIYIQYALGSVFSPLNCYINYINVALPHLDPNF